MHRCLVRRYLADIVAELRHPRVAKEGTQTRLLFKKRMFRCGEALPAIGRPHLCLTNSIAREGWAQLVSTPACWLMLCCAVLQGD
jgi:hypothetical protein